MTPNATQHCTHPNARLRGGRVNIRVPTSGLPKMGIHPTQNAPPCFAAAFARALQSDIAFVHKGYALPVRRSANVRTTVAATPHWAAIWLGSSGITSRFCSGISHSPRVAGAFEQLAGGMVARMPLPAVLPSPEPSGENSLTCGRGLPAKCNVKRAPNSTSTSRTLAMRWEHSPRPTATLARRDGFIRHGFWYNSAMHYAARRTGRVRTA